MCTSLGFMHIMNPPMAMLAENNTESMIVLSGTHLLKNSVDHLRNIKRLSIQIVLQQGLYTMEVCWLGVIKIEINVHILLAFSILVLFISVVGRIIPFTGTVIRR